MRSWAQTLVNHVYEFKIFGDVYILHAYCKPININRVWVGTFLPHNKTLTHEKNMRSYVVMCQING